MLLDNHHKLAQFLIMDPQTITTIPEYYCNNCNDYEEIEQYEGPWNCLDCGEPMVFRRAQLDEEGFNGFLKEILAILNLESCLILEREGVWYFGRNELLRAGIDLSGQYLLLFVKPVESQTLSHNEDQVREINNTVSLAFNSLIEQYPGTFYYPTHRGEIKMGNKFVADRNLLVEAELQSMDELSCSPIRKDIEKFFNQTRKEKIYV